ncbi:hypothetical protein ACQ4PT_026599 [Festuca glaucescens]
MDVGYSGFDSDPSHVDPDRVFALVASRRPGDLAGYLASIPGAPEDAHCRLANSAGLALLDPTLRLCARHMIGNPCNAASAAELGPDLVLDQLSSSNLWVPGAVFPPVLADSNDETAFAQLSLNQSGSGTEEVAPYELMQQMVPLQELEQNNHDQPGSLASPNLVICHSDMPVATVLQGNGSPRSSGTSSAPPLATQASHHGTSVCSAEDAHAPGDTTVFTIPPQVLHKHSRGHGQAVVEDRDEEKEVHREFNIELKKCGAHHIICMMCFLSGYHKKNKTKLKKMRKEELKDHCKSFHGASGIKCAKKRLPSEG